MIKEVLAAFPHLIQEHRTLTNRHDRQLSDYKARLTLVDASILEFSEIIVFGIQKRKYSFQWMDANFDLIMRWDNALHHPQIATFPHHKHVGDEYVVEASEEMFLTDVLSFIGSRIKNIR